MRREARERHCLVADESAADEDHVELDSLLDDSDHADEVEGSSHDEVEAGSSDHELDVDGSLHSDVEEESTHDDEDEDDAGSDHEEVEAGCSSHVEVGCSQEEVDCCSSLELEESGSATLTLPPVEADAPPLLLPLLDEPELLPSAKMSVCAPEHACQNHVTHNFNLNSPCAKPHLSL